MFSEVIVRVDKRGPGGDEIALTKSLRRHGGKTERAAVAMSGR